MPLLFGAGCSAFQGAGEVQSGRQALLMNQPETALAYFQKVAASNPDYIYHSMGFSEGIWTYVGRAQYGLGKWSESRRSLERALSVYKDDPMAPLYLGLALTRSDEREQGLKQIDTGLKSVAFWLDYLNSSRPMYAFWDPSGHIRKEIEKTLEALGAEKIPSVTEVVASAEWVGQQMEEEVDRVRGDERRQMDREFDRDYRQGVGIGIGIGF